MPWSRLRVNRPTDGGRRSSFVETAPVRDQQETQGHSIVPPHDANSNVKSPSPLRQSIDPSNVDAESPDVIESPTETDSSQTPRRRQRFSMLRYKHASDPQLFRTAKEQANAGVPPVPGAPAIITTAPTDSLDSQEKRKSTFTLPRRYKAPESSKALSNKSSQVSLRDGADAPSNGENLPSGNRTNPETRITFNEPEKTRVPHAPPPYGDESHSSLALPVSRLSESSRSDGSGENGVYATTTTTHTVSTTTTFFRLPRRKKKDKGPLFPLPPKTSPLNTTPSTNGTPRVSTSRRQSDSPRRHSPSRTPPPPPTAIRRPSQGNFGDNQADSPLLPPGHAPDTVHRDSAGSAESGSSSPTRSAAGLRGRSSTKGSLRLITDDGSTHGPGLPASGRTSSSTAGRPSFGGVFPLSRLRQNSEPHQSRPASTHPAMPGTPISAGSKSQSFNLARETLNVPERQEGETAAKYLIRLEENISRRMIATVLSQKNDEFSGNVLRSYMRGFKFFGEPLDMAVRKMLMEVELPKETQQIDRVLQAFANRYHECNPGVYASPDEAYFIAFSILILHTDVFNKNNKNKMQKPDYTKNARGQGVADEILECFYDNISYTPFIHVEGDLDVNGERTGARKLKKAIFTKPGTDSQGRPSREPVDPYTVILDGRMDSLRPPVREVMNLEDHFNYLGTASAYNLSDLSKSFFKSGVLQIVSSRSRPEAFMTPETMANPAEGHPGVVDMKVTKVGILWRKDTKKKKGRSPWQEWGAVLTGTSLYFFRNTSWVKSLMHQHESHHKHHAMGKPCIFKPPLEQFKPDVLMPTQDAVALVDTTYKKHKNALLFVRHGCIEETFLADSEADMNDWLAKLNFAAAFRTAGVHMRELIEEAASRGRNSVIQRTSSSNSAQSLEIGTNQVLTVLDSSTNDLAQRVQAARRQMLDSKIAEADEKLAESTKQLEAQLRNARHLQILAPIQNKTREQVVLAAGGMAAKIKWMRLEMWRTRCHRDILAKDLDEDLRVTGASLPTRQPKAPEISSTSPGGSTIQPVASQEEPLTPRRQLSRPTTHVRPATQPSPGKSFSLDDVFAPMQTPSPVKGQNGHKSKGSWELPPLSFQPTRTSLASGSSAASSPPARNPLVPQTSSRSVSDNSRRSIAEDLVANLVAPVPNVDPGEQEVLRESGILEAESTVIAADQPPLTPETDRGRDTETVKTPDPDYSESRSKVRRSLHRTLRESTHSGVSHHRSRKGKDSASSGVLSSNHDDNASLQTESEGLARSTGSFTVHGKKASVITFGSEWSNMSPEERLNLRKQAQSEGSKLSVPAAIEDEETSTLRSDSIGTAKLNVVGAENTKDRPVSGVSTASTATTTKSAAFEEAPEAPIAATTSADSKESNEKGETTQ